MVEVAGGELVRGELIQIDGRSLAALHRKGVKVLKELVRNREQAQNLLKELAETLVRLRVLFRDPRGESHAYKMAAARIYADSGIPTDAQLGTQAAVRHHIGNVLREIVPAAELEAVGLHPEGPTVRRRNRRKQGNGQVIDGQIVEEPLDQLPEKSVRMDPRYADDAIRYAMESVARAQELLAKREFQDAEKVLALLDELKALVTKVRRAAGRMAA